MGDGAHKGPRRRSPKAEHGEDRGGAPHGDCGARGGGGGEERRSGGRAGGRAGAGAARPISRGTTCTSYGSRAAASPPPGAPGAERLDLRRDCAIQTKKTAERLVSGSVAHALTKGETRRNAHRRSTSEATRAHKCTKHEQSKRTANTHKHTRARTASTQGTHTRTQSIQAQNTHSRDGTFELGARLPAHAGPRNLCLLVLVCRMPVCFRRSCMSKPSLTTSASTRSPGRRCLPSETKGQCRRLRANKVDRLVCWRGWRGWRGRGLRKARKGHQNRQGLESWLEGQLAAQVPGRPALTPSPRLWARPRRKPTVRAPPVGQCCGTGVSICHLLWSILA